MFVPCSHWNGLRGNPWGFSSPGERGRASLLGGQEKRPFLSPVVATEPLLVRHILVLVIAQAVTEEAHRVILPNPLPDPPVEVFKMRMNDHLSGIVSL